MYQGLQARESLVIQYLWGLKCAYACVGWGEGIILGGGCVSGWTLRIRIRLITKNLASKLFKCFKKNHGRVRDTWQWGEQQLYISLSLAATPLSD